MQGEYGDVGSKEHKVRVEEYKTIKVQMNKTRFKPHTTRARELAIKARLDNEKSQGSAEKAYRSKKFTHVISRVNSNNHGRNKSIATPSIIPSAHVADAKSVEVVGNDEKTNE